MRLFLLIVIAGVVSFAAGIGVVILTSQYLPSYDDAAGRGLGELYRLASVVFYAVVAMIVFGSTARGERGFRIAIRTLVIVPAGLVLFGVMSDLTGRADLYALKRQFFSAIQVLLPLWTVVLIQWFILRWGVNQRKVAG
jgi:hypothetical protein